MMKALLLVILTAAVSAKHEEYNGWKTYSVEPSTPEQLKALGSMMMPFELDPLGHATVGRAGVMLVKPEHQNSFTTALEKESIKYRIHSTDIKARLDIDDQLIKQRNEALGRSGQRIPYDNYQPIDVIEQYLEDLAKKYPNIVTVVSPANSTLGHPIKYVKISSTNFEDTSKPVIVMDSAFHPREWITVPVVAYAIHKLVEDLTEKDLLDDYDWIFLPVANPDGYKHTFRRERFWRKTRSFNQHPLILICRGVDPNRNFNYKWNETADGTGHTPCSHLYAGPSAFSEPETRVLRDILHEHLDRISWYLAVHSYGSMFLYPWSDATLSSNALNMHVVGVNMAKAIDERSLPHFPNYIVGNSALVIGYKSSGTSKDYAHSIGVPFSYTLELPGFHRDDDIDGLGGFHLEPRYIPQVCNETWAAIVVGARRTGEHFRNRQK